MIYLGVWSYVLWLPGTQGERSRIWVDVLLLFFSLMCYPLYVVLSFAHSWVEPSVEQTLHVACIIVETRLTFHLLDFLRYQWPVSFVSRFLLTPFPPWNVIWPHFLLGKWGLECRCVCFPFPVFIVVCYHVVVASSVPRCCNVRVPLCPRRTPCFLIFLCLASIPVRPPVRGYDPSNARETALKFL